MVAKNVIVTSFRLSAIGWFTGVLSEIHKAIYKVPINWNYEISRFECTRVRRPLPQGYNTVWNANPLILANRGFDKVIVVKRSENDILEACCWYDKQKSYAEVRKMEEHKEYLTSLRRNYRKLYDVEYNNARIFYVNINDLNINPMLGFNQICDFLNFDIERRPIIIPVKVWRDWQVYAGHTYMTFTPELNERLKLIKNAKDEKKNTPMYD